MLLAEPNAWDRELWGDRAKDGAAIYLHRLAIDRKFAGQGAGKQIMAWAEKAVPEQLGKRVIRLDCLGSHQVLNDYYLGLGYSRIGYNENSSGVFSLFEKRV